MISIGAVVGGPECSFFLVHLTRLMTHCNQLRIDTDSAWTINVVYHLPGSVIQPDYVGLRTGTFSRKQKLFVIQVGVEAEWIASTNSNTVLSYIHETVDEALGLAKGKLEGHGVDYDLIGARRFLDNWKAAEGFTNYLDSFPRS